MVITETNNLLVFVIVFHLSSISDIVQIKICQKSRLLRGLLVAGCCCPLLDNVRYVTCGKSSFPRLTENEHLDKHGNSLHSFATIYTVF